MTDDNNHTVALADLSVTKVRDENPQVAEALEAKEERIDDLQDEKADLKMEIRTKDEELTELKSYKEDKEDEEASVAEEVKETYEQQIDELQEELATKTEIIEQIRDNEREDLLAEIRQARASIKGIEEDEVELAEFEDRSPDELRPVAEALTEAADAVAQRDSSQSASSQPEDISSTQQAATDDERMMEVAREMGVAEQLEKAENLSPQGFVAQGN